MPKVHNSGGGLEQGGNDAKTFWCQYNKERTKCCHMLKADKFFLNNYMGISSTLMLNFLFTLFLILYSLCFISHNLILFTFGFVNCKSLRNK